MSNEMKNVIRLGSEWRMSNRRRLILPLVMLGCAALCGCGAPQAAPGPPPPPEVLVSLPVSREVTDYEDFPGRTEAVVSVDIRARVNGYLEKVNFREGAEVKQGAVLFEIDQRPYKAALDQAVGNLASMEARLKRLDADLGRAQRLVGTTAMSREDYDKIVGDRGETAASLQALRAAVERARLDMDFTKVLAPSTGRISRRYIDPGNLVKADDTILTTLVSLDPIYAYFDLDERTTLRLQRLFREHQIDWTRDTGLPVSMGLADEEGFSQQGRINFADNRVDPDTGTWRLRGLFPNPQRLLSPGLFVRIRLPVGQPYSAILISEQALGTDQGQKFVYVINDEGEPAYRRVKVGRLHEGLRVITDGLQKNEKIVVSGLQRVHPGGKVSPKVVDMPVVSRDQESGVRGQKSEVRSQKSEVGNQESGIRSQESGKTKAGQASQTGSEPKK
jgi:RND family efflux transporter MFP subunit